MELVGMEAPQDLFSIFGEIWLAYRRDGPSEDVLGGGRWSADAGFAVLEEFVFVVAVETVADHGLLVSGERG
jgi:hypothetical protein